MLISAQQQPIPIEKEIINSMRFGGKAISSEKEERRILMENLRKALIIGNTNHTKVKIVFKANGSLHVVDTTIWGLTKNYLILKSNTLIPIASVKDVLFE